MASKRKRNKRKGRNQKSNRVSYKNREISLETSGEKTPNSNETTQNGKDKNDPNQGKESSIATALKRRRNKEAIFILTISLGVLSLASLGFYVLPQQRIPFSNLTDSSRHWHLKYEVLSPIYFSPGEKGEIIISIENKGSSKAKMLLQFICSNTFFRFKPSTHIDFGALEKDEIKINAQPVHGEVPLTFPGKASIWEPWGEHDINAIVKVKVNDDSISAGVYTAKICPIPFVSKLFWGILGIVGTIFLYSISTVSGAYFKRLFGLSVSNDL